MTFAILPPEMRGSGEPTLLCVVFVLGVVVCLPLAFAKDRLPAFVRLGGIICVCIVLLLIGLFLPSVARVERLYHNGHDQFYWGSRLLSKVPDERREAATALAALLKSSKSNVRVLVLQDLGECLPTEQEIALDALLAFAKDEQESEHMRWNAQYALGIMFFQHVVGELGLETDREPYEKIILT